MYRPSGDGVVGANNKRLQYWSDQVTFSVRQVIWAWWVFAPPRISYEAASNAPRNILRAPLLWKCIMMCCVTCLDARFDFPWDFPWNFPLDFPLEFLSRFPWSTNNWNSHVGLQEVPRHDLCCVRHNILQVKRGTHPKACTPPKNNTNQGDIQHRQIF